MEAGIIRGVRVDPKEVLQNFLGEGVSYLLRGVKRSKVKITA